jgi:hypothetical protein
MCQRLDGIFVRALDLLWKFGERITTPAEREQWNEGHNGRDV